MTVVESKQSQSNDERFPEVKPTEPGSDTPYIAPIIGKLGYDTDRPWLFGLGTSPNNGVDFHVFLSFDGLNFDDNDIDKIWNGGTADKVKQEVDSATTEIPAAVSAANSAVSAAESAVAASKVNSDAIVAQSEAISEAKAAMDSATAEIQQTAANAASDAAKIRADVARVQNEVDTAKAANSASVEALKSDVSAAKQDLADVHDSLDKAQSAIEQNQKLINDNVAKITSDVSATKQDLATVHDSLAKEQAAAEQNQKAIDKSIAQINDSVDATNQDLAGVRKDLTKAQSDITANQKSINDNVAQINANITQDRKDIASARQANADTAKQLDDYSKQAAAQGKTIKTIQDKQDGFTATLADVQGNVSQVSDKVDGLSANLKDAQGNVASVKAQADQLSATLTDHAKSIATLTASAKELSSTLEDADGRLSKVEQTAKTNSSTLADVQGDLSQVKQDATALTSTLKDAQGNISTLQQKADSVSAQLTSAQGDIATLQTGVDSVKAMLTSHDKSIHTLQADSKSLKDSMADAQGDISTLQKSATSLDSEMKDHAGRLSKVEQSAATQATTLSDLQGNLSQVKQQADGLVTTLKDAQGSITQIQQKADGTLEQLKSAQGDIASLQTDVTGIKATLTSHEGDIHTLQADSKTLKDDMADAQGNISSLQKSSTKLDSEMSSQDGRLSKVEQTAKEHTTTISDLGDKFNNMKVGGRNLLHGTSDQWRTLTGSGWLSSSTASDVYTPVSDYHNGDQFTYSAIITNNSKVPVRLVLYCYGADKRTKLKTVLGQPVNPGAQSTTITNMISVDGKTPFLRNSIETLDGKAPDFSIQVKGEKLEAGNKATAWTPNPDDMATLTQVKQTADGIETTLKSAQGDIDQIKQTAKGTSEQLADVQGNVTNIQKDIDGLKQTTADNAGNIHTLQSDSKSLHDSMQDAQGDISTLKKTSTDVTSELKDHAGRISKTEQTASTLVNEFADQQGHLNRVEQTAQGTQQTVANQQGQINNIKTDASGIHETLTGQGNQIASINVTLSGLNSKYEDVSGDLGKLSDKVTTNTTQITQNKKEIDLKADQSTVDSLTGEVSQNKTQLQIQAGQISSKVSSADFKTLNDKVGNLQAGSQNLIADGDANAYDATPWGNTTFRTHLFYYNSTKLMFVIDTSAKTELTAGCPNWFPVKAGHQYTLYFNGFMSSNVSSYDVWLLGKQADAQGIYTDNYQIITGERLDPSHNCIVTRTFTVPSSWSNYVAYIRFDNNGSTDGKSAVLFFNEVSVKEGNINTGYSPAPEDSIALIKKNTTAIDQTNQKISLKADQTEVDKIKNTATQNSSRLDVMAGEIKSKVTSTDVNNIVDSKGYATTSTVQSLITQKAGTINESITNLTSKIDNLSPGTVNILRNTDPVDSLLTGDITGDKWVCSSGGNGFAETGNLEKDFSAKKYFALIGNTQGNRDFNQRPVGWDNSTYLFSIYAKIDQVSGVTSLNAYIRSWSIKQSKALFYQSFTVSSKSWKKYTFSIDASSFYTDDTASFAFGIEGKGSVDFAEPMLVVGNQIGNWSPAPSDNATVTQVQEITASIDGLQSTVANKADKSQITQLSNVIQSKVSTDDFNNLRKAVDLQTLDSADINNMKTNGHYFVHNLANNPVGGWVYVDVTGNGADRIRQDVYQDNGNQHKYRRWFGDSWTAWSQGATESEITQLRDDINLRVKSGDLLSQINLTAHNTLIQSNKIYLDSSSTVFSGKAFIPSAAIVNLDVAKLNAGTINTDRIHIGDDSVYLSVKNNYLRLDGSNTKDKYQLRLTGNDIEFADNDSSNWEYRIQHGIAKYQTDEDGLDFDVYSKRGGANHTVMAVSDAGVMISPSLFFQTDGIDSSNWMGFTRNTVDGNSSVSFHTWDDNNEGFHVDCGARFMNYVYINGYARAQGWLTNSTLSKKTSIAELDTKTALDTIRQDKQYTYEYRQNVEQGENDPQASFIIDDVNAVSQYTPPKEFLDRTGKYREPGVELSYLVAAVQELDNQVQAQAKLIKELKEKANE